VTDRDVLDKAVAAGIDPRDPVSTIMGPPPPCVGEHAPVTEALERMVRSGARAVAVTGGDGRLAGLLGDEELLVSQSASPLDFLRELSVIRLRKDLADQRARLPSLVRRMMLEGARIESLTWLVSTASDLTLRRLIELAVEELGPPPAAFAFLALGSEGRREQTLSSDQDNALVWADGPGEAAAPYFRGLGERVCVWLSQAGLEYCPGNVMASNPRWCQPLSVWKEYFAGWVKRPEPQSLLNAGIFFDFRGVWGEESLAAALRAHVQELLAPRPGLFFRLLAGEVSSLRPVLPARGTESAAGDAVDLKPPVANLSDLTRLYALWHGVPETGTLPRLRQLESGSDLGAKTCQELGQAYTFLTQTRLARQVARLCVEEVPSEHLLRLRELTPLERRFLEQTLELMRRVRQQVERNFLRES
jgi:CBS domain-containing protein